MISLFRRPRCRFCDTKLSFRITSYTLTGGEEICYPCLEKINPDLYGPMWRTLSMHELEAFRTYQETSRRLEADFTLTDTFSNVLFADRVHRIFYRRSLTDTDQSKPVLYYPFEAVKDYRTILGESSHDPKKPPHLNDDRYLALRLEQEKRDQEARSRAFKQGEKGYAPLRDPAFRHLLRVPEEGSLCWSYGVMLELHLPGLPAYEIRLDSYRGEDLTEASAVLEEYRRCEEMIRSLKDLFDLP